ncbi:hypothetical protein ACU8DI_02635 [Psychroserpens sp. BH13MA-6]
MNKFIAILIIVFVSISANAQEVKKDGKTYEVKKEKIFLDGKDVTATLNAKEKSAILERATKISEQIKLQKEAEKKAENLEKEMRKAEKSIKKAEKAQKKAEKELKRKEKAQKKFEKASKKYKEAQKKYDRLKRKGKLSPEDDAKWLKKLENLKEDAERAKKKL